jgi:exopolyphosphatase/guanosine-5'-triphosphate,3'-diphosphate pyrophosphatase
VRVAVVDIGTNSTRLLVADVAGGRIAAELERITTVTRLGAGVDADGRLREDAMQRVYSTLDGYRVAIRRLHVDVALAVLTSAARDSANGAEFADTVSGCYGLTAHVLSGDEEARLTYLGATSERDPLDSTPTLVLDIGGGSTEVVIGSGARVGFHVSTQAGVVRQTERHLHSDPPDPAELDELVADVRSILERGVPPDQRDRVGQAIAVAGTATSLAAITLELEPYDPERVHGYILDRSQIQQILVRLAGLTLEQRSEVPGLQPGRAPTIVAGVAILLEALQLFGLEQVEVSEHDILRGAALGLTDSLPAVQPSADPR